MHKKNIKTQTKKTLIDAVYQNVPVSRSIVEKTVSAFIGQLAQALKNGERVELRGLGVFVTKERKLKSRYDFTLEKVISCEHISKYISFIPSSVLKNTEDKAVGDEQKTENDNHKHCSLEV
ncbi:MAG: HU family DNA-binding protein [Spirochaetaceae bacterium]|nr:HU family DNA-binding protein [Spirochaetaceae bacterium]